MNKFLRPSRVRQQPAFSTPRMLTVAAALFVTVLISSCGGGTGLGNSGNNSLTVTVSETRAFYQVLDLSSWKVTATGSVADLSTNAEYQTTKMVFRLINPTSGTTGSGSSALGAIVDLSSSSASLTPYYLAVFETTQAQWQLCGGGTPWTALSSADGANDIRIGNAYPAIGVSPDLVTSVTQTVRSTHGIQLAAPSNTQWEIACRSGGSSTWSWGEARDSATVTANAVVWETAGTQRGARTVGGRSPSALGLYDMHGNVWEITSNGHVRGGSWNDPLSNARAAHQANRDPATRHLLVGVRLVYIP